MTFLQILFQSTGNLLVALFNKKGRILNKNSHVVIIGAGIVGLATASELTRLGHRVTLVEKEQSVASHQTSRNSGVIHAGPYYKPGSLKARLCKTGATALIEYCQQRDISYRLTGKLIVADKSPGKERVQEIYSRAIANDVDVELVDRSRILELEPNCVASFGLHVKSTGIVDYREVAESLRRDVESEGASVVFGSEANKIKSSNKKIRISHSKGVIEADFMINAAGLQSDRVALLAGVEPSIRIFPFRGQYFEIASHKSEIVRGLIYPAPDPEMPFLGVHLTRTLAGGLHAGPNATLVFDREGYGKFPFLFKDAIDILLHPGLGKFLVGHRKFALEEMLRMASKKRFMQSISRLVDGISAEDLIESPTGIRAQAMDKNGKLVDDFVIQRSERQIHVLNAPSPAATASLAIGQEIAKMFLEQRN